MNLNDLKFFLLTAGILLAADMAAQIIPQEAVSQMKKGINMGNTLEPPYEGGWNNPYAREYYFDLYSQAGFDVVRVPVRWDKHTSYDSPYTVDQAWMDRVEEVLDWGLERDLFIVVNAHHDDWIKNNYDNPEYRARFDSIWSQIAGRFRDKSEKLIFEILNEPHGLTKAQNDELHKRVLSSIRRTNPTRNVIIQGNEWGGARELIDMAIPEDDYLIGSFHTYDPWPFGLEGHGSFGPNEITALKKKFQAVKEWSDSTGIPVFLGEFGCHKDADYNLRTKHYKLYVDLCQEHGFTPCVWDDGGNFRILERESRGWNEIKDILIHSPLSAPRNLQISVHQDTMIKVGWTNVVEDHDSIIIERRRSLTDYSTYAVLPPDTSSFVDPGTLPDRYYHYRIIAHYDSDSNLYSRPIRIFIPQYVPGERGLFLGEPLEIPGTIEAEHFDLGGEGIAYHDMDDLNITGTYRPEEGVDIYDRLGEGYHIGNALPGEWVEYTVDVESAGEYLVDARLAAMEGGGRFAIRVGDKQSDTLESESTGSWLTTTDVSFTMQLEAGEQVMRFSVIDQPLFNIDKTIFSLNTSIGGAGSIPGKGISVTGDMDRVLMIRHLRTTSASLIRVYDITGSLVKTRKAAPGEAVRLETTGMRAGIYLIRATSGARSDCVKVMISNR